ncbi:glycosyltransferase family 4 protein [Shewanella gaetbuli]|uniref:Glycosyltransferase family 4 protein n=1 Tax=Shewanella gaetbuli TaxID=220752 RepID=A0A9X1ZSX8_9GAMM|nr:glycosyltransferase family 4 protein [Shewanella gaetbuli]MCL1141561.1 glycosyltransferase family 4 protein [Shewanella gaetbuli]
MCSDEFPPEIGGSGSVAFTLLNSGCLKYNDIDLLTKNRKSVVNGVGKTYLYPKAFLSKTICCLFFFIALVKYDYILINDRRFHLLSCFLPQIALRKIIYIFHGQELETFYFNNSFFMRILNVKNRYSRNIRLSSANVFVSKFIKDKISKHIAVSKNIVVINPSISPFIWSNRKINGQNLSYKTDIVFCSVCRLVEEKGLFTMLDSFRDLVSHYPERNFTWKIAGDGPDLKKFSSKVKDYGLEDSVITMGSLSKLKLSNFYCSSDIFWLLSHFEESFGLVFIEAASFGLYTVGYKGDGVSEATFEDNRTLFSRGSIPSAIQLNDVIYSSMNSSKTDLNNFLCQFSPETFKDNLDTFIHELVN